MTVTQQLFTDPIGETLLITLYMKYRESNKPDPIIKDDLACRLVKAIDYDFARYDRVVRSSVGVAIRSTYFDDLARAFIEQNPNPVIIVLGCGLDGRHERIGASATKATFYQLDIPEVISKREQLIPPTENETYISASMFDVEWMDEIKQKHTNGNFLIIIEGVLMYFAEARVKTLFQRLAQQFSGAELVFDVINSWIARNSHRHDAVKLTNAAFDFGTNDDRLFEQWADNLKLVSSKLFSDFPAWKRAGFLNNVAMRLVPRFKTAGRMLHYIIE